MSTSIVYADEKYFKSFHHTLDLVAKERIYIEMIEAPPFENVAQFQRELIAKNSPNYYALEGEKVVGWCDISIWSNPRMLHNGSLGMGFLKEYRGKGLGSKILSTAIEHAKKVGIEKIELKVYTDNAGAVGLYKKLGFEEEGVIKRFRKLDGRYFDALCMAKFL